MSLALLFSAVARADPQADALVATANDLAAKGRLAEACVRFEAAQRQAPALDGLMGLADCHEHLQLFFRAWGEWKAAYDLAKKTNAARADVAHHRAEALVPLLPHLKIDVTGSHSELTVWRDDKLLDSEDYSTDLPVAPGTLTVTVRRGAKPVATKSVELRENEHLVVSFDLDAIAKENPIPAETQTTPPGKVVQTNAVSTEHKGAPSARLYTYIFLGAGITVVALGTAFIGIAAVLAQKSEKNDCWSPQGDVNYTCSTSRVNNIDAAYTLAQVGPWLTMIGAASIGTAIVLDLVLPKEKDKAQVSFMPLRGGGIIGVGSAF